MPHPAPDQEQPTNLPQEQKTLQILRLDPLDFLTRIVCDTEIKNVKDRIREGGVPHLANLELLMSDSRPDRRNWEIHMTVQLVLVCAGEKR